MATSTDPDPSDSSWRPAPTLVLSRVKLIAEPWDVGMHGWRTDSSRRPFWKWNDCFYRDGLRTFWLADSGPAHGEPDMAWELGTRLAGSRDLFGTHDRGPNGLINYVAAHDGFTLADTTAYDVKHNLANGEGQP